MAKQKTNETNGAPAEQGRKETLLPLEADVHLVAQSLAQALASYTEKTRTSVNDDILAATEVLSSELRQQFAKSEKELAAQQKRLSKLERVNGSVQEGLAKVQSHEAAIATHAKDLSDLRETQRSWQQALESRLAKRVDAIAGRLEEFSSALAAEAAAKNTLVDSVASLRLTLGSLKATKSSRALQYLLNAAYGVTIGSFEKIPNGGVRWFRNVLRRAYRRIQQLVGAAGGGATPKKADAPHRASAG